MGRPPTPWLPRRSPHPAHPPPPPSHRRALSVSGTKTIGGLCVWSRGGTWCSWETPRPPLSQVAGTPPCPSLQARPGPPAHPRPPALSSPPVRPSPPARLNRSRRRPPWRTPPPRPSRARASHLPSLRSPHPQLLVRHDSGAGVGEVARHCGGQPTVQTPHPLAPHGGEGGGPHTVAHGVGAAPRGLPLPQGGWAGGWGGGGGRACVWVRLCTPPTPVRAHAHAPSTPAAACASSPRPAGR